MKKILYSACFAATTLFAVSCGNNNDTASHDHNHQTATTTDGATTANQEVVTTIELNATDEMKFDATAFAVPAGQEITLTLHNVGKMPKESMGHNFVLLKEGSSVSAFGNLSVDAAATDYIPESAQAEIIAHTKVLGPGESETIKFTIDKPGVYPFLCSFPGHYSIMKGIIEVK